MRKKISQKKNDSFQERFAQILKLPEDLIYKEPIVSMLGCHQLRIENYQKLLEYHTDKIIVRIQLCKLIVSGKNLKIICYTNDEMYISGEIRCISYEF